MEVNKVLGKSVVERIKKVIINMDFFDIWEDLKTKTTHKKTEPIFKMCHELSGVIIKSNQIW